MATLIVGRHSDSDIVIDDPSVSRRHADLTPSGGGSFVLRDTESAGGTFIKDGQLWRRVHRATVTLKDVIKLGSSEYSIADLLSRLPDPSVAFESSPKPRDAAEAAPRKSDGKARFERDPETGLIVEKR